MLGKALLLAAAAAVWLFNATGSHAADTKDGFTGLWQGIDNVDGSLRTLSFADVDGDGVWEVRGHDTYWTLCEGPGGLEDTTGKIEKGVLHTKGTIACANGKKVQMDTRYEPQGALSKGIVLEYVEGKPFRTLLFKISR